MLQPLLSLGADRRVVLVDMYDHGDVMWALIQDSQQRTAHVCIDCRPNSPTRNRLFDRARHPQEPSAILIELGAPEEGIAVSMISRWCDEEDTVRHYREAGVEMVKSALLHLGDIAP